MAELTAEQIAQRAFDTNLLDERQLDSVWAEFGTRNVPAKDLRNLMLRRELLTNYQLEKLLRGDRSGYYYGDYKILYLVGTGTFARVFRAVRTTDGRVVAVKVLRKRWTDDIEKTEQFLREGQMGATLRHPSIVPIYEVHSLKRAHFLVMEFVEGHNLRHFVRVRQMVEPPEAVKLMCDICSGLAYAFEYGVTHRDLKMSNVLVSSRGRARLVDFGLAAIAGRMSEEALSEFPNPRTIDYAALERATGVRKDDKRSDIYFSGCILYHMLTGKPPLRETRDRTQRLSIARFEEIVPITNLLPDLPTPVAMVVNRAMELNPSRRHQTPAELLEDLQQVQHRLEEADENGESLTPGGAEGAASQGKSASTSAAEGHGRTVMIVESDVKMQDLLRGQLKRYGYRVLVFGDPQRARNRFQDQNVADCVVFCSGDMGQAALEAFNEFGRLERTKKVPAILLLNEKQKGWEAKAHCAPHRSVLSMPVRMRQLRETLQQVLQGAPAEV